MRVQLEQNIIKTHRDERGVNLVLDKLCSINGVCYCYDRYAFLTQCPYFLKQPTGVCICQKQEDA